MADRSVVVKLKAEVTQYIAGIEKAKTATKDFRSDITKAAKSGDEGIQTLGNSALVVGGVLAAGFAKVTMTAADFEKQMSGVKAVSGASAQEMDRLSDAALAAGASTKLAGVTASDAARAEAELVKAGVSVADVLGGGLMGSLTLASAGQLDFAKAAEIAAQAMNIFDLAGSDVSHVADVLAAAANKSAADVGQLGDALRQGGLVAAQTGLSLEESVGALAAFADNALIGSDAGTSLKTMLQRLTPQSEEAAGLMEELGFSAYDASGNFIGLEGLAGELQDSLGGLTVEQRNSAMATLFGSDAVRAANILYEEGAAGIADYVEAVDDQGAAARMAAEQNNNLKGDIEALGGALESAFIENGSKATGALRGLTQGATDAVTGFSAMPDVLQTVVAGIGGLTGVVGLAAGGFAHFAPKFDAASKSLQGMDSTLAKFAGNNLGKIAGGIAGIGAALAVGAVVYEKATAASREYETTVSELTAALNPVTEGQADLNTELKNFLELESAGLGVDAVEALNQLGISFEDIQGSIEAGGDALDPFRDKVRELGVDMKGFDVGNQQSAAFIDFAAAAGVSVNALKDLVDGIEDWDDAAQDSAKGSIEAAVANDTFTQSAVDAAYELFTLEDGTINYVGALNHLAPAAEDTAGAMVTLADGTVLSAEGAKEAEQAVNDLMDAYRAAVDPLFGVVDALQGNRDAQAAVSEAIAANSDSIDDNNVSVEEMNELYLAAAKSALDVNSATQELAAAVDAGTVSVESAKGMLAQWVEQGLITADQAYIVGLQFEGAAGKAEEYSGTYVATAVANTSEAEAAWRRLYDKIRATYIAASNVAPISINQAERSLGGAHGGLVPSGLTPIYRAGGGPIGTDTIPMWATPGEFMMQKSAVDKFGVGFMEAVNRGQLSAMGGGSSYSFAPNIVVHATPGTNGRLVAREIIDELGNWARSNGPLPAVITGA